MSAGSERADVEGGRDDAQERKDERVNEGSEMSNLDLRTPKANEAQDVHLPD